MQYISPPDGVSVTLLAAPAGSVQRREAVLVEGVGVEVAGVLQQQPRDLRPALEARPVERRVAVLLPDTYVHHLQPQQQPGRGPSQGEK